MIIDKPICFTKHFRDRMLTFKLQYWQLFMMLPLAEKSPKPVTKKSYPTDKTFIYCRYGTYIFTFKETQDNSPKNLGMILLGVTLTDQRIHLPYRAVNEDMNNNQLATLDNFVYDYKTKYE